MKKQTSPELILFTTNKKKALMLLSGSLLPLHGLNSPFKCQKLNFRNLKTILLMLILYMTITELV